MGSEIIDGKTPPNPKMERPFIPKNMPHRTPVGLAFAPVLRSHAISWNGPTGAFAVFVWQETFVPMASGGLAFRPLAPLATHSSWHVFVWLPDP
jgi:hypothetical protein